MSNSTPVTITSGYFPEVELLGGEWSSEAHFPEEAERGGGGVDSPFAVS